MIAAEIISLRNDVAPEAAPASEVDKLRGERAGVVSELQRLAGIDEPVRAAEAAVAGVDRAIAVLDEAERAEARDWAVEGKGAPPKARNEERVNLVRRRIELQSDLASATNRAAAVQPKRAALNADIKRLDHLIFAAKLRGAVEEARRLDAHAHQLVLEMREPIGKVVALKFALMQHQSTVDGNAPAQRLIGEAIDALNKLKMPELGGDPAKLGDFVDEWQEMLR